MISFLPGSQAIALAGLAAATAPLVIHLLNRRRYRVLDWAALDFLLDASKRSRRFLELRDLAVLALRTVAVACFALGVARPFLASGGARATTGPVHAVIVVDNSLSMGRERLGGRTLLDDARDRVREFIDRLPAGSRTSVIPLCGPAGGATVDPLRTADDAAEALDAISVVDREGTAVAAVDLAMQAAALAPDVPAKRLVFIGDQQEVVWPSQAAGLAAALEQGSAGADGLMQVVAVQSSAGENSWVESLRLDDGLGDIRSPGRFTAVIRHEGAAPRRGVTVTLAIDGAEVGAETIDLEPGQARELVFVHDFDAVVAEPGRPALVTARVALAPDGLPGDDSRAIVVPVVDDVPVVFVDQFGAAGERPSAGRYGETRHLRRLLAPATSAGDGGRPAIDVRHLRLDELDAAALKVARLVVVAGVRSPEHTVPLLRDYVAGGGRLVIAAGGEFDAGEWQEAAWLDGAGILPLPLAGTVGGLPEDTRELQPMFLDWGTMRDDALFRLPGVAEEELADLYGAPVFLKAVACADGTPPAAPDADASADGAAMEPARVLAAFDTGVPFLVSRRIGSGRVVWVASGLFGPWNTLPRTNAMLLCDRLLRSLLAETFPPPEVDTADALTLPLEADDRRATIRLARPDGEAESLAIEALGEHAVGVTVRDMSRRGIYTVAASRPDLADRERREVALWTLPLAANGPARESWPRLLDGESFAARLGGGDGFRWVEAGAAIGLDGGRVSGQGAWWWLLLAACGCLVTETAVLARTSRGTGGAA